MKISEVILETFKSDEQEEIIELYYGISEFIKYKATDVDIFNYYRTYILKILNNKHLPENQKNSLEKLYVGLLRYRRTDLNLDIPNSEQEFELKLKHGKLGE